MSRYPLLLRVASRKTNRKRSGAASAAGRPAGLASCQPSSHPDTAGVCRRVGAERRPDPWPPGTRRTAGGGCAFRAGPHLSRPSAQQCLRRQRWMSQAEPTGPLYAATLSDSRLGATTVKGHGRLLPAVSATTARSRMGARVLASGMPVGIRLCGVRRRHLFGCQGALSVLWGAGHPRLRDYQRRIHTARVQRGGVNPGPCARGSGAMSLWPVADWPVGRWLKLALVGSIAQAFWAVSRRCTCTFAYPCQPGAGVDRSEEAKPAVGAALVALTGPRPLHAAASAALHYGHASNRG